MSFHIEHPNELLGNAIRRRLESATGRGQRTYTPTQAVVARAEGSCLWTVDGRMLHDFASGVLVANLGHQHAGFEARYAKYCAGLPRNAYNLVTEIEVLASERLVASMPNPKAQKVLWAASGSEGVQKAMWAALASRPGSSIILATLGGFHGKKGLAGDVTGETSSNPNVRFVPFPLDELETPDFYRQHLDALAQEFPNRIALLITEPYLGAKGSYHPPHWYHQLLQDWCVENDVVFIFDEVQSCFGRTGNMYAFETYGVQPDLTVLGKGMANGEPAAAVVGRADLIDALEYGAASDTFSGNPCACAAVLAALETFAEEAILEQAARLASVAAECLAALKDRFPFINRIRGEGLVYGIEMEDAATASGCVLEAYLGSGNAGVHFLGPLAERVLRFSPPLITTEPELREGFALLESAWERVDALHPAAGR